MKTFWALAITTSLSACSGGDDGGGGGGGGQYTCSLTAGGTHYETATTGAIRGNGDGTFTFGVEFDPAAGIGFNLTASLTSGTQSIAADSPVHIVFNSADSSYTAGGTRGSGSANITVDGTVITGTFAFEALEIAVGDAPIAITDGMFGVELVN